MTDDIIKKNSVKHFMPRWPSKIFILSRCSVLHLQFWRHNEGTYDVIKNHIPHEEYLPCAKFQFFLWCGFRDTEVQRFSIFPTWLPHHVTYDVIVMNKTFYMSSRSYGGNFSSIRQMVVERNTRVLCGQTNKQTNGPKCNTLSSGEGKNRTTGPAAYLGPGLML